MPMSTPIAMFIAIPMVLSIAMSIAIFTTIAICINIPTPITTTGQATMARNTTIPMMIAAIA